MENFTASVQYGDWKGTAAADDADGKKISDLLKNRGLLQEGEFVVGVRAFIGENHGGNVRDPYVEVLIAEAGNYDTVRAMFASTPDPLPLKKVILTNLTLVEFIGLFKRLEIAIARSGLDLPGRQYQTR